MVWAKKMEACGNALSLSNGAWICDAASETTASRVAGAMTTSRGKRREVDCTTWNRLRCDVL